MTLDTRPGLNLRRLVRLMGAAIDRCTLDLEGRTVLTEAASGAYAVTPVLAAMAGADVYALAAGTAYASANDLKGVTAELATLAGVADRIQFVYEKNSSYAGAADIVTNSGQVRPIDATMIASMKSSAVVPLMYESWEYRSADVDLEACRSRGIIVAGTNEQHPSVDVFSFLGHMAIRQLHDAGIAVRGSRIVLLCDNSFGPYIVQGLKNGGAEVVEARELTAGALAPYCDAVILALQPAQGRALGPVEAALLSQAAPGAVLVQYWGEANRAEFADAGVPVWPEAEPGAGHMGILPSALGPEPVIRLQSGGLKVGQILAQGIDNASVDDLALVQPL
jgi:hypothetical protein